MALDPSMFYDPYAAKATTYTTEDSNDKLSKDDFMLLFLEELKQQDPMDVADSDKMLEQTMQMAQLESSENQAQAFEDMNTTLSSIEKNSLASFIGRMATFNEDLDYFRVTSGEPSRVIFISPVDFSGTANIIDDRGEVIETISLSGKAGNNELEWDGLDRWGDKVEDNIYSVTFDIKDASNIVINPAFNNFKIEGISSKDGESMFSLGNDILVDGSSIDLIQRDY